MATVRIPADIIRQAAQWAACLDAGADAAEQAACEAWCQQDPRHRLVLDRMHALGASLAALDEPQKSVLRSADAGGRRAIALRGTVLLLATVAVAAGVVRSASDPATDGARYRTVRAEHRTVALPDSSLLELDADTEIRTQIGRAQRIVALARGRVLANVASDRSRPFIVETRDATATALGTAYVVEVRASQTRVTVLESRVRVCRRTSDECAELAAGEMARIAPDRLEIERSVDLAAATAWRRGWIEADDVPVTDVLEELARHLPQPLHFDRHGLAAIRVTGSFPLSRPRAALDALEPATGVTTRVASDGALRVDPPR